MPNPPIRLLFIDDDPGLARQVERDDRLGELVAGDGIEEEQRADAGKGGTYRVDVEQLALRHLDAGRKGRFGGVAGEYAYSGVALDELVDDVAADAAGGSDHENGQGTCSFARSC